MRVNALTAALLLCLAWPVTLAAAEFSIRQWSNDSSSFISEVLEPVAADFAERGCVEEIDFYVGPLFEKLRHIKTKVSSKSYLLLRDIILVTAEDLAPFEEQITCEVVDRWRFVRQHVETKIELIGNVLMITE